MEIILDFYIIPSSPKNILISDSSVWEWAEDSQAFLSIIPPGSRKCITIPFEKDTTNTITSDKLNLGCDVDLKDGIYEINLLSGLEDINLKKYYLKTDHLELEISRDIILAEEEGRVDSKFIDSYFKAKWYLDIAKAYTKEGKIEKAMNAFNLCKSQFKCKK